MRSMNCLTLKVVITLWFALLVCGCDRDVRRDSGTDVLSDSDVYKEALEIGKKHVKGRLANMSIVNRIRRSKEVSVNNAEEWKSGYISGYVQGKLEVYPELDKRLLYRDAENEYNALSRI